MKKFLLVLSLALLFLLMSCGGTNPQRNLSGKADLYRVSCYSNGRRIFNGDLLDFQNASGWYRYEDGSVGNHTILSGDCIYELIGKVEIED